jgi:AraC family transcriptional regulator of adaptative response / DNA-3-methyladenine glycosylase II
MFVAAVRSTGIYCRPSCPAVTPRKRNIDFFPTAAAAQAAGFRACKRCRPDATPGSPEWNVRADLVARAMRSIADGVVDREGVSGLAQRLHVSERHLHRQLSAEVGAGPQALARAHRAQTARVLIETTDMSFAEVAFAAGFASIRQFNDAVKTVFASTPTELRTRRSSAAESAGTIELRLPYRPPLDHRRVFDFLRARAVPGVEESVGAGYRRTLSLPYSSGIAELRPGRDHIVCKLSLGDVRDLAAAVQRCRRLFDLDADPVAIDLVLAQDPLLRPSVETLPGTRVPGAVDGEELTLRAVMGQGITIRGARTLASRLVSAFGKPLTVASGGLTHLFPDAETVADSDLGRLGMPRARQNALKAVASAMATGNLVVDPAADREEVRRKLLAIPGIGPWTAAYVLMRALADPDAFMATDLGVVRALQRAGVKEHPAVVAERWRPWRAYAQQHIWRSLE